MIDFEASDDQKLIVDTLRQFAAQEIRPRARECDEVAKLPDEVLARAHELGLVAHSLPTAYGGGGERSAVTGALVAEELAHGDLSIALAVLSPSLLALPIADFGSDEQRARWLPGFVGERFTPGSLAWVEPRMRFDPLHPETRMRRDGGDWILDGVKCFVPWIEGGNDVLVIASHDAGPGACLVPRDAEGLTAQPEKNMGLRALPSVELALDGVRVPAAARVDIDPRRLLSQGRVGLAATAVGVARASFEIARDYAKERETFGAPIATRQAIAFKLADMAIEIDGARLLTWEAAWRLDEGNDALREATLAYQQAQRVSLEVADGAVQVLGGHGYTREYLPEMHLRNARGFASFEALTLV